MLMTCEGFSHSGRLGIWVDWDWGEVNLLHPPLLLSVCILGTGYDENAHMDHVVTPTCSLIHRLVWWHFSGNRTATFPLSLSRQRGALD